MKHTDAYVKHTDAYEECSEQPDSVDRQGMSLRD